MAPASPQAGMSTANTRTGEAFQNRAVARSASRRKGHSEDPWRVLRRLSELRCEGTEKGEPRGGACGLEREGLEL
jgi:hypothetical protein